jgi:hypothetical protein
VGLEVIDDGLFALLLQGHDEFAWVLLSTDSSSLEYHAQTGAQGDDRSIAIAPGFTAAGKPKAARKLPQKPLDRD